MPFSTNFGNNIILSFINQHFDKNVKILDVGTGAGKYGTILRTDGFDNVDGLEIFEAYFNRFKLNDKYRKVYNENIINFEFDFYDVIIMTDILEHLTVEDSKALLEKFIKKNKTNCIMVRVPFQSKQGVGKSFDKNKKEIINEFEIHIQEDLTKEIMIKRYPYLRLLAIDSKNVFGVYCYKREE